jgi:hypothetical protein
VRLLLLLTHAGLFRNFDSTLRELVDRGHEVHLSFDSDRYPSAALDALVAASPNLTVGRTPPVAQDRWSALGRGVRAGSDYVRYLGPRYVDAPKLRARARRQVPAWLRWTLREGSDPARADRWLRRIEAGLPLSEPALAYVREREPDLVAISPLFGSAPQLETLRAARALGVPTCMPVASWDNLTNKGLLRVVPDNVIVWNEAQKREAVSMHGMKPENVVVTGATVYDQWFARRPTTSREEFCAKAGLDPGTPFLLYLCSSQFIAPDESEFIARWIHAVRTAPDPRLREIGILIRPHPENIQPWQRFEFGEGELKNVTLWPRGGANPIDRASKNDYFDSMYHSVAAVGINTSAQIESGIVGRPVFSVRVPEYQGTQEGTLHFHYLLKEGGGLLTMGATLDEHVSQLPRALDRTEADRERLASFIETFVRPRGLGVEATPVLADAIVELASRPRPAPERTSIGLYLVRAVLFPIGVAMKAVRYVSRLSRKRERQMRPLTIGSFIQKRFGALVANVFRWKPAKKFAQRYVVPRVLPEMMTGDQATAEMAAIPKILQRISNSGKPIIVGPWLSEVGFELLYWIPFLNWVKTYRPFDAERMYVVSRGGAGIWYQNITKHYIDLFDFYTPEQYRAKNTDRQRENKQKHLALTDFDREILKVAYQQIGSKECDLLHPMYMYQLFYAYWKSRMSVKAVDDFTSFERLPAVDTSFVAPHLPDNFTAVRFYFNESFPDNEENKLFVSRLLDALSEAGDVVLLNPDLHIDDHWDPKITSNRRIHSIDHLMTARNNLEIQTKVISRSRAFVGTYGGLSYLAPFYGVTSLAFYSHREKFSPQHLEVSRRVFGGFRRVSYVVLDTHDIDVLGLAFGEQSPLTRAVERTEAVLKG